MNSPKYLNYETRPLKFTERKMLLSCLTRLVNFFNNQYQYIGLGGVSFTDFKLFHKELHISDMYSIEAGNKISEEKLKFNSPYAFIKIIKDLSTNALNSIPLDKRALVWLDYDGNLEDYMFNDITTLFSKLPEGSIYIMTCNRELKYEETGKEYTSDEFKSVFGHLIPFQVKNKDFSNSSNYLTIRKMLKSQIDNTLNQRAQTDTSLKFEQLFNITYQENRGAQMYTYGGIITTADFDLKDIFLEDFEFLSNNEETYNLDIPNFTRKEIDLVDTNLIEKEAHLLSLGIVLESELNKYKKTYKYIPNFFDVRV